MAMVMVMVMLTVAAGARRRLKLARQRSECFWPGAWPITSVDAGATVRLKIEGTRRLAAEGRVGPRFWGQADSGRGQSGGLKREERSALPRGVRSGRAMASQSQIAKSAAFPIRLADADLVLFYSLAFLIVDGAQSVLAGFFVIPSDGVQNVFASLNGINAGQLLAFIAICSVLKSEPDSVVLSRSDFIVLALCATLLLPPVQNFQFVGATIAGLYLWLYRPYNAQLASVGQLWLAISFNQVWGRLFFKIVFAPLVQAEAFVIAELGGLLGLGLNRDGITLASSSGWSIFIAEPCSSFHNISLSILVWLSLIKLNGATVGRRTLIALGTGALAIICLNAFRILLMATSEEAYHYWHEGGGTVIYSCLTLAAIAFPTILSLRFRE